MDWRADAGAPGFAARREMMLERLADAIGENLDTSALAAIAGVEL